ncbi:MAG: sulfotransferase domain-containing protein [Gammaproteobacteria bacterium]|nr:sulfotransferase domain-containing protein [Gammaproteobacteria bacterium]
MIWLGVVLVVVLLFVADFRYLGWYLRWERRNTSGMAYYGKTLAERRALKERICRYSLLVRPLVKLLAIGNQKRATMPVFEYEGVCGPPMISSSKVFERAKNYRPRPEDIFVVTQMRCGTTWMQQIVYEIVHRGQGDLSDRGHGHLYAICPWIDGINSVSLEDAPLVGEKPTRIIKSHLPTKLCPYSERAKYIYVTRHPVSCFASIVDFNRTLLGPLMPALDKMVDWFCSDRMYWLPWAEHVAGWWRWAQSRDNVLFLHYEDMTRDFAATLDRVAPFLGYQLTADEKRRISAKCSFQYMKDNEELFEMAPPNMFSVIGGQFLASGKESRYKDVTPAIRERILDYCRQRLRKSDYPAHEFFPDLVNPPASEIESVRQPALELSHT